MKIWQPHREDENNEQKKEKKKRRTVTWKDTLAGDLERKWQQRRMMGDNKEVKGNMLLTYPSPDTESACG